MGTQNLLRERGAGCHVQAGKPHKGGSWGPCHCRTNGREGGTPPPSLVEWARTPEGRGASTEAQVCWIACTSQWDNRDLDRGLPEIPGCKEMNSWSVGRIGRVHVMYSARVQIILEAADAELPLGPSLPSELSAA